MSTLDLMADQWGMSGIDKASGFAAANLYWYFHKPKAKTVEASRFSSRMVERGPADKRA